MTTDEALKIIDDFAAYEILTPDAWAGRVLAAEVRRLRDWHNTGRLDVMWQELVAERDAARAEAARLRELAAKLSEQMFSVAGFLRGKDIPEYDRVWQMAFDAKAALEGER